MPEGQTIQRMDQGFRKGTGTAQERKLYLQAMPRTREGGSQTNIAS